MSGEYIVRADYYPNGIIIPLGITDSKGETEYINKVLEIKKVDQFEYSIRCITDKGKCRLVVKNNRWSVVDE